MMRERRVVWTLALCLSAGVASQPVGMGRAWAQQAESFEAVMARAGERYEAKDYAGAIEDFKRAYEIKPVSNLLYNIARTYEKLGQFEEAVTYYERFVNEPEVSVEARTDALARLKALREVVALRKQEADAKRKAEEDKLKAEEAARKAAEEEERRKKLAALPPPKPDRTMSYIFMGAGGLALVGSGVFALMASGAHGDFEDAATLADRRSAASDGQTYSVVADSLLGVGVVLAAVGVVFFFTAEPEQGEAATTLRVMPAVGADRAAVQLRLDF
jgi:tetratricopeptide (TPR) repeat protein